MESTLKHFRAPDGTRIAYRLLGPVDGPPLVLCDGIACDGFIWTHMIESLATRFRVLHNHHRGHGRSGLPRQREHVTIPYLVEDIVSLMAHVGFEDAIFMGHSMGCQVTLEMASRHPTRVRAAALLCGAHGRALDTLGGTDVGFKMLPSIKKVIDRFGSQLSPALRFLVPSRIAYAVATFEIDRDRTPPAAFQGYLDHLAKMPHDAFLLMLEDAAERLSDHYWSQVNCPVLLMPADEDGFTPIETSDPLRDGLPHVEYSVIERGSHIAPVEFPEVVLKRFNRFVEDHDLMGDSERPVSHSSWAQT